MNGTVVVVGLGLMGGSVARALARLPEPPRVLGVDSDAVQGQRARAAEVVHEVHLSGEGALPEADVVVYATPLGATLGLLREHAALWREGAWVTDVVSLKAPLHRRMTELREASRYVGAHPMAGGTAGGFAASDAGLLDGARVWLTADPSVPEELNERARAFWSSLGGLPEWIDPEEHDRTMAWVSHLPQLVANALAGALDAAGVPRSALGPGGRDMTRLAGSDPELWKELFEASAPTLGTGVTSISRALQVLGDLLARREVERVAEFMERTRAWASEEAEP